MAEVNNDRLHIRLHVYDEEVEVTIAPYDDVLAKLTSEIEEALK